jgi:hypothetical protein
MIPICRDGWSKEETRKTESELERDGKGKHCKNEGKDSQERAGLARGQGTGGGEEIRMEEEHMSRTARKGRV